MRPEVAALLARSTRRLRLTAALYGAAGGLAVAAVLLITIGLDQASTAIVILISGAVGAIAGLLYLRFRMPHTPVLIEQRAPECRNRIVTAVEVAIQPERVLAGIAELVHRDAASVAATLDAAALFPLRRASLTFVAAATPCLAIAVLVTTRPDVLPALVRASEMPATITGVEVIVTPPAYTGLRADTLFDPARIDALAGSRIDVLVRANAERISIETITRSDTVEQTGGRFRTTVTADADGYISLAPITQENGLGPRKLIGLSVRTDEAPRVRITAPGRDLFAATVPPSLELSVEADDDHAVASLSLHYTKVTGSGEQFTFTEGEAPLTITRTDSRTWKARGMLVLDTLKLAPGDMVVYRAIATDRRPGAPAVESDTYIVEATGAGALAAGGFTIDEDRDRYAVSQQMLIVFTERLIARRDSLTATQLREESLRLAAVQRQVRAEFVFMLGGELADDVGENSGIMELHEHAEAEAEDDILAGRHVNRGRLELVRAIRWMSSSAAALTDTDLTTALTHERNALDYLQRAFSRTRYILRTLTERESLDLSRRLTGTLADASSSRLPTREADPDERTLGLRRVLAGIAELSARVPAVNGSGTRVMQDDAARRIGALAQSLLHVDPASEPVRKIASQLTSVSEALANGDAATAHRGLEQASLQLAALLRRDLHAAPWSPPPLEARQLDGVLVDALRRAGVR